MSEGDLRARAGEVRRWIEVADKDRRVVALCVGADEPVRGIAAFHCQQAIEKLLKGFLVLAAVRFGKTHSLPELGQSAAGRFPDIRELVATAATWTVWGTAYRYPAADFDPEPEPDWEEIDQALVIIDALAARLAAELQALPGGAAAQPRAGGQEA